MLSENRQQLFLALPSKQIVLSLQYAWLDVSFGNQLMLPQPEPLVTLTLPFHNLHELFDLLGREVADTKPLELPSTVRLVHRRRLFLQRSDSVRHMEVQDVDILATQLFFAGCKTVSDILKRVGPLFHGADFGAETCPAQILLCQSFLAGTEVVDRVRGGCVELDMAMLAEELEGILKIIASEGVADASGAEDDFCGFVGGHRGDVLLCHDTGISVVELKGFETVASFTVGIAVLSVYIHSDSSIGCEPELVS